MKICRARTLRLARSQNASDCDNLRVRKISTSKRLRVRIIHVSKTFGKNLLVVSPVCYWKNVLLVKLCKWTEKITSSSDFTITFEFFLWMFLIMELFEMCDKKQMVRCSFKSYNSPKVHQTSVQLYSLSAGVFLFLNASVSGCQWPDTGSYY